MARLFQHCLVDIKTIDLRKTDGFQIARRATGTATIIEAAHRFFLQAICRMLVKQRAQISKR
jgi:hypothetical protein